MSFDWLPYAYWALIIGCFVVILLTLKPSDDASSDGPHGDIPFIPGDLKTVFHGNRITEGGQPDNGA